MNNKFILLLFSLMLILSSCGLQQRVDTTGDFEIDDEPQLDSDNIDLYIATPDYDSDVVIPNKVLNMFGINNNIRIKSDVEFLMYLNELGIDYKYDTQSALISSSIDVKINKKKYKCYFRYSQYENTFTSCIELDNYDEDLYNKILKKLSKYVSLNDTSDKYKFKSSSFDYYINGVISNNCTVGIVDLNNNIDMNYMLDAIDSDSNYFILFTFDCGVR